MTRGWFSLYPKNTICLNLGVLHYTHVKFNAVGVYYRVVHARLKKRYRRDHTFACNT